MQLKLAVVFVSFIFLCVSARPSDFASLVDGAPFRECDPPATGVKISNVNITPTCTGFPCVLNKGKNASVAIGVASKGDYNSLTNVVTGRVFGANVPFQLPEPDACKDGIPCPVKNGQSYDEKVIVPILKEYPDIVVDVTWKMNDDKGNTQGCFVVQVKIQ